jgi:hypothetical protein
MPELEPYKPHPSHEVVDMSDITLTMDLMCVLCDRKDEELNSECPMAFSDLDVVSTTKAVADLPKDSVGTIVYVYSNVKDTEDRKWFELEVKGKNHTYTVSSRMIKHHLTKS